MELLANLELGFEAALSLHNLAYCFLGVLVGTAIGVLPGLGPIATIAMLLPITYTLEPVTALIMLSGIYYGAQYGGSTTAILVNLPGESSSVVTCIDGYQMARRGRAGAALSIAALGSFFAGSVATLLIAAFSPILATVAYLFGPTEYFSLMLLGLVAAVALTDAALLKSFAMVVLGLIIGLIGIDANSGQYRFTFGMIQLADGVEFVALAMGFFAVTDIIINAAEHSDRSLVSGKLSGFFLTRHDIREAFPAVLRGTGIGSVLGLLPGGGAMLSSFASYTVEKRLSSHPEEFGKGAIAGVAGPESANNAGAQTSFIPMLTLGIPSNGVMALMMGAMMIHNIQPGPQVMVSNPVLFWGLIASMWIGNAMLVILNLPLISIWVKLVSVPYRVLFPSILVFCAIGLYSIDSRVFDISIMAVFGVLGYLCYRMHCAPVPLLLGFILGPIMEQNLRTALVLSFGDPSVFVRRPLSATMLAAGVALLIVVLLPTIRARKAEVFTDGNE
jgi:putative tricarboxylic transport membrane protein